MFGPPPRTTVLIGAAACWGLGTVLSKYALGGFDAAVLLPFQLTCSVLLLGAFLFITGSSVRGVEHAVGIGALGVLNPGIAYALGLTALAQIDASVSVVIWATEPVLIVLLAFAFLRERLPRWSVLCLASAMAGVALIVGAPAEVGSLTVVVLTFAAVLACALYSILLRRMELADGTLPVVFLQQASALAFALVVLFVAQGVGSLGAVDVTAAQMLSAISGGALYYGAAFLLYVAGLRRTSAARAGMFLTLIPVFGLVFSTVLLGETMDGRQFLGSMVVIGSMAVRAVLEAADLQRSGGAVVTGRRTNHDQRRPPEALGTRSTRGFDPLARPRGP
jgi:drug/metabolite transporter (DMT)-like permease